MVDGKVSRNDPCPCGSGLKYKKCCLRKEVEGTALETPERFGPQPAFLDDTEVIWPARKPRPKMQGIWRVALDYTFPEEFGEAKVSYDFPKGRLIVLENGFVLPVEKMTVGMRFVMEHGEIATVTKVAEPKWWDPPPENPIHGDLYHRRVIGRVEHVGNVVMDVFFAGQKVTTTPDHLWFSITRDGYVPAEQLRAGELLKNAQGEAVRCEGVSEPRFGLVKLYNIEIEQFHNYFVGGPHTSVQVHNGVPGAGGCGVPMPANADDALYSPTARGVHDAYVQRVRPGAAQQEFPTPWSKGRTGARRFDDFDAVTGTAYEGNTTPWESATWDQISRKLDQAAADFAILRAGKTEVKEIIWFGTHPLPETGPAGQLYQALQQSGIKYLHIPG